MSKNDRLVRANYLAIVADARTLTSFGAMDTMSPERLALLDSWLDSRDAANEGPDGELLV
jgi:hypothetical protein